MKFPIDYSHEFVELFGSSDWIIELEQTQPRPFGNFPGKETKDGIFAMNNRDVKHSLDGNVSGNFITKEMAALTSPLQSFSPLGSASSSLHLTDDDKAYHSNRSLQQGYNDEAVMIGTSQLNDRSEFIAACSKVIGAVKSDNTIEQTDSSSQHYIESGYYGLNADICCSDDPFDIPDVSDIDEAPCAINVDLIDVSDAMTSEISSVKNYWTSENQSSLSSMTSASSYIQQTSSETSLTSKSHKKRRKDESTYLDTLIAQQQVQSSNFDMHTLDKYVPPYRLSTDFCIGLSDAYNCGDIMKVAELLRIFALGNVLFRMTVDTASFHTRGINSVVKYFQTLMDVYPDGVMFVKRVESGSQYGIKVLKSKMYFSGTKVNLKNFRLCPVNQIALAKPLIRNTMKGLFTTYLDAGNRVVIMDDVVKCISRVSIKCE